MSSYPGGSDSETTNGWRFGLYVREWLIRQMAWITLMDYGLSDYEVIVDTERRIGGLRK